MSQGAATGRPSRGRGRKRERSGLLLLLAWAEGREMSPVLIYLFPFLFSFSQISYAMFKCILNSNLNMNACKVYHHMSNKQANIQAHNSISIVFYSYVDLFILIPRLINFVCGLLCKVLKSSNFQWFLNQVKIQGVTKGRQSGISSHPEIRSSLVLVIVPPFVLE